MNDSAVGVVDNKFDYAVFRSKLIDTLLDIRLSLSVKKIISNFISKVDFKALVDKVKEAEQNLKISEALDSMFDSYFSNNKKNDYIDKGEEKGQTKRFASNPFKNSDISSQNT